MEAMILKAELLFNKIEATSRYQYIGEYPLQVGTRRIEPKDVVDLEEIGLQYAPDDKRKLHVDFVNWSYQLRRVSK